jgi:hypothetical protein
MRIPNETVMSGVCKTRFSLCSVHLRTFDPRQLFLIDRNDSRTLLKQPRHSRREHLSVRRALWRPSKLACSARRQRSRVGAHERDVGELLERDVNRLKCRRRERPARDERLVYNTRVLDP